MRINKKVSDSLQCIFMNTFYNTIIDKCKIDAETTDKDFIPILLFKIKSLSHANRFENLSRISFFNGQKV